MLVSLIYLVVCLILFLVIPVNWNPQTISFGVCSVDEVRELLYLNSKRSIIPG